MTKLEQFREQWAGRKFRCKDTKSTFQIPEDVAEGAFYPVGNGYVDVGRLNAYCRFGGNIEEVE
jgi:hypothetical protein